MRHMTHILKTWPGYFEETWNKNKLFEVRKNDRGFSAGDTLILQEWDPETKKYTGRVITSLVTFILHGGNFGISKSYCVMQIRILDRTENRRRP